MTFSMSAQTYIDLGLPSGTKWATTNEVGLFSYDLAMEKFSANLPTKTQWEELMDYCDWTWTGRGYKIVGPNNRSIFLPAEGRRGCKGNVWNVGERGYYWSSTPEEGSDEDAYHLSFQSSGFTISDQDRCEGNYVHLVK